MKLAGQSVALSIGGAPDLAKLGYPKREVERALLTICGALVREGATIVYGGDLRPNGFTIRMYQHLTGAYSPLDVKPFRHFLPEPALRRTSFDDLVASLRESQAVSETLLLFRGQMLPIRASGMSVLIGARDGAQQRIDDDNNYRSWLTSGTPTPPPAAYSFMRAQQTLAADARIAMGGKMGVLADPDDQYEGAMPGVVEEALLTILAGKPLIPLGAFGGATRDIALALSLLPASFRSPRTDQAPSYTEAIERVRATRRVAVPKAHHDAMYTLCQNDSMEDLAARLIDLLASWLPAK